MTSTTSSPGADAPVLSGRTNPDPSDAASRPRLESLTGLRFLAALAVFGLHLDGTFYFRSPLHVLDHIFVQGSAGVSFFFVLSGFVLTWSHSPGDKAGSFYRRRIARIGPLQAVTWALMAFVLIGFGPRPGLAPAFTSLFLLSPWIASPHFYAAMNIPSWSLGCEAFFYVLFPFALPVLRRVGVNNRRLVAVAALAGIVAWAAVCSPGTYGTMRYWAVYFFPPARLAEFVIGIVLALELAEGRLPKIGVVPAALLAAGAYEAASWVPDSYGFVAVTLVPFALLIVAAAQSDISGRPSVLRSRTMVRLGTWSFAFYLVHLPVLTVLAHVVSGRLGVARTIATSVAAVALSVGCAAFLYRTVERPCERLLRSSKLKRSKVLAAEVP